MIRGKYTDITLDDVMQLAEENGIRKAGSIIHQVVEAIKDFRQFALKHGAKERWINAIENTLKNNLEAWGLTNPSTIANYIDESGRQVENVRIEQQFKGNYHLLASIDGRNRKYVIRKRTEDHETISQTGIANLSADYLKALVSKYLCD